MLGGQVKKKKKKVIQKDLLSIEISLLLFEVQEPDSTSAE